MKKLIFLLTISILSLSVQNVTAKEEPDYSNVINITVLNRVFSPNGDGVADELVLSLTKLNDKIKIKYWDLDIINENNGKVVFSTAGENFLPELIKWDGHIEGEATVLEGSYKYIFTAQINKTELKIEESGIILDVMPPFISLNSSAETAILTNDNRFVSPLKFNISVGDENEINMSQTKLQIVNFKDKAVKEWIFHDFEKVPSDITWNGRDDIYDLAVPAGEYKVVLTATDVVGNTNSVSKTLLVLEPVKGDVSAIQVKEEERGLAVTLSSNVLFASGSATLKKNSLDSLHETIALLNAYPANKVLIEGHTDSVGSKKDNLKLSQERAISVYKYFVKNGVSASRLQAVGYGKEKPLSSNKTAKGREANRRVTIIILKNEDKNTGENTDKSAQGQSEKVQNEQTQSDKQTQSAEQAQPTEQAQPAEQTK